LTPLLIASRRLPFDSEYDKKTDVEYEVM
jgi:hypothetical protein